MQNPIIYAVVVTLSCAWSGLKSQVGLEKDWYPLKELSLDKIARLWAFVHPETMEYDN